MGTTAKDQLKPGEKSLATLESVTPTVNACLSELTSEVQELIEWAETSGADAGAWGLDPVAYLAAVLRRRNPSRAATTLKAAKAAAATEITEQPESVAIVSSIVEGALQRAHSSAGSLVALGMPEPEHSVYFTESEADAIVAQLRSGSVYTGGCRLPLLRVEANALVVTTPELPPALGEEAARNAALAHSRDRITAALPPVLGTGLAPSPARPTIRKETRVGMAQAKQWLMSGGWETCGLADEALLAACHHGPASLADGLRLAYVTNTFTASTYATAVLTPVEGAAGSLDLRRFTSRSRMYAELITEELSRRKDVLEIVQGLGICSLRWARPHPLALSHSRPDALTP